MVTGTAPVESHLHKHMIEHLNAEITLGTITDLEVAMKWIQSTFLYVRAIKNPTHYGFAAQLSKEKVEKKLEGKNTIQLNYVNVYNIYMYKINNLQCVNMCK